MTASADAEGTGPVGRVTRRQPLRVVAFGGGHGLNATLRALVAIDDSTDLDLELTAVVTVGDDGGSSGRLRAARGVLPPGDLRQALAALAGPGSHAATVAALFQHRFTGPVWERAARRDRAAARDAASGRDSAAGLTAHGALGHGGTAQGAPGHGATAGDGATAGERAPGRDSAPARDSAPTRDGAPGRESAPGRDSAPGQDSATPGNPDRDAAPRLGALAQPGAPPLGAIPQAGGASRRGGSVERIRDGLPPPPDDGLSGHAVGNLVLAGLLEMYGDPVVALDHAAAMVQARGRVLPMSPVPVRLAADIRDETRSDQVITVLGQHAVAICSGRVEAVRLTPKDPPACDAAVAAVGAADWLVFGPGSWYTSVIPHLLVPDLAKAILGAPGRRLVILNLAVEKETSGLSLSDHLGALTRYLPGLRADVVLADGDAVGEAGPVRLAAETLGARLVLAPVAVHDGAPRHDPSALAAALLPVLTAVPRTAR